MDGNHHRPRGKQMGPRRREILPSITRLPRRCRPEYRSTLLRFYLGPLLEAPPQPRPEGRVKHPSPLASILCASPAPTDFFFSFFELHPRRFSNGPTSVSFLSFFICVPLFSGMLLSAGFPSRGGNWCCPSCTLLELFSHFVRVSRNQ